MSAKRICATKIEIIRLATKMFLKNGFTSTSLKAISNELGISAGNLAYHFPTKEHLLFELAISITDFHLKGIEAVRNSGKDDLFSYCWEVTAQIALSEIHPHIKDIYLSIYSHPMTLSYVKDWTAQKNLSVLGNRLKDWQLADFRLIENVSCCIERSALTESCDEYYRLADKIRLTLDCLLKLYDIEKSERVRVIDEILQSDYIEVGETILKNFTEYVERENKKSFEYALNSRYFYKKD